MATNEANPGSFSASGRYAPTILLSDISAARAAMFGSKVPAASAVDISARRDIARASSATGSDELAADLTGTETRGLARLRSAERRARAGDARAVAPNWVETANIVSGVVSRRR